MTKEKYIEMCEAFGDEIDYSKMPPDYEDFPSYVHTSFDIYNHLPDRFTGMDAGMIYIGKDLSPISTLFDIFNVKDEDRLIILEVIGTIDRKARDQSIKSAEKAAKGRK